MRFRIVPHPNRQFSTVLQVAWVWSSADVLRRVSAAAAIARPPAEILKTKQSEGKGGHP